MKTSQSHISQFDFSEVNLKKIDPNWFIVFGIVQVALGIVALAFPLYASIAFDIFVGTLLVISGIFQTIHAFKIDKLGPTTASLFFGFLYLATGVILLVFIPMGIFTLTLLTGSMLFVLGLLKLFYAVTKQVNGKGWSIASSIALILLSGLIFFGLPHTAFWILGFLFGIDLILLGAAQISFGTAVKDETHVV